MHCYQNGVPWIVTATAEAVGESARLPGAHVCVHSAQGRDQGITRVAGNVQNQPTGPHRLRTHAESPISPLGHKTCLIGCLKPIGAVLRVSRRRLAAACELDGAVQVDRVQYSVPLAPWGMAYGSRLFIATSLHWTNGIER